MDRPRRPGRTSTTIAGRFQCWPLTLIRLEQGGLRRHRGNRDAELGPVRRCCRQHRRHRPGRRRPHRVYETDTGKLFYDGNGSAAGEARRRPFMQSPQAWRLRPTPITSTSSSCELSIGCPSGLRPRKLMLSRRQRILGESRMDIHKNARLTPRGRERMANMILGGQTPQAASQAAGVCPRTVPQMGRDRFEHEGLAGCRIAARDPSGCAGRRRPSVDRAHRERCAASADRARRSPPTVGVSPATVSRVLKRLGLKQAERPGTRRAAPPI